MGRARGAAVQLGLIEPLPSPSYSQRYRMLNERYENMAGLQLDFYGANYYDGCWLYALSVLRSNSTDVAFIKDALRQLALDYVGVSGYCELDENDDRLQGYFDMMGYFEVDGEYRYLKSGFYNATTGIITWDEAQMPNLESEAG